MGACARHRSTLVHASLCDAPSFRSLIDVVLFGLLSGTVCTVERVIILFVAANSSSTERLALDLEYRALDAQHRRAVYRDAIGLAAIWAARPLDLASKLNESPPSVVHFAGHGTAAGIVLVDDLGRDLTVPGTALRALLVEFSGTLKLVVLNACYSDAVAREIVEVVGCVIGMPGPVGDRAARAFSEALYAALCAGRSVACAFQQALVLGGLERDTAASRDLVPSSAPGSPPVAVLRTRRDVDPDQLRLVTGATLPAPRRRHGLASALAVAACAALAITPATSPRSRSAHEAQPGSSWVSAVQPILVTTEPR